MNQLNPVNSVDSALREAVLSDSTEKIRDYCKNYNINHINEEGFTALHLAIIHVKDRALTELILCGADTNLQTRGKGIYAGTPPVHVAVHHENYFALSQLLNNRNTEIDQKNRVGHTALHQAIIFGDGEAVKRILDRSPNSSNVKTPYSYSAECLAYAHGYSWEFLREGRRYHQP